jgi:ABC-2 type transport system permease protein
VTASAAPAPTPASTPASSSTLPPLAPPSATTGLFEVFRRRYLLRLLVRRELSARYQGSILGMLWSYINPLSQFLIYYFVMGVLFNLHQDVQNFAIHMFCGIIVVGFFTECLGSGTRSVMRNKALVRKMAVPREMFPVASVLVSAYHVLPQIAILVIASLLYGWTPDPAGLAALVLSILIVLAIGTAVALMFSAANVFFRDVSNVVQIASHMVRFGVPMIYPYTLVAARFHGHTELYLANPIAEAVLLMQRAFWVGTTDHPAAAASTDLPDHLFTRGILALLLCLVLLGIGQLVFSRLENKIPERLS